MSIDFGHCYDSAPNAGGTPIGYNSPSGSGCLTEEPSPLDTKGKNHTIAQAPRGGNPLFGPISVRYPEEFGVLPKISLPESHGDVESRMQAYPNVASEWRLTGHLVTVIFADGAGIAPRKFHVQDQTYSPPLQLLLCVSNLSTVLSMRVTWETAGESEIAPFTAPYMPFLSENAFQIAA
ncbi:hypothetical protein FIBSPDRAFT_1045708 [Athelia psychrophila]|uniref:Uncharacterized protein n=1 Tax=Athelia psychrophila TaxID=1759441 RepID=A0A166HQW7_9AGAM|nr:hypothetical protein FIBSPDRAFT_1045708 [Fibularhizoctonia sp. CBS 109695]